MRFRELYVFLFYLAGAVVFTFPLIAEMRTATTDHADPLLDAWSIAWVAHQLPRDPAHLFDANRFYPEKGTLAFTDPMLAISVPMAPVSWLTGSPLVTLHLAMFLVLAVSGYGAYRLGWHVTGSRPAGLVAGGIFAFNAYRLTHLAHVNLQAAGFIPFLYLSLRRFMDEGRVRDALGIGAFLFLVSASCAYYGMFTWVVLGVAVPYELFRSRAYADRRRLLGLGLALGLSALAYLPLALPLMRLGDDFGLHRPLERLQRASARPGDYLRSGTHLHEWIGLKPPSPERTLFPGLLAVGLGVFALTKLDRSLGLFLLIVAFAAWASLGPAWGLYRVLHAVVPGLAGVRVPPRLAIYVLFGLAMLAARGAAAVLERFPYRGLAALLVVFPLAESLGGPIPYARAPEIPSVYRWLEEVPGPVPIVEMPLPPPKRQRENAPYLYFSTAHFKPLANGYATVVPPVYAEIAEAMRGFPTDEGVKVLNRYGFRYVILHRDRYLRARAVRIEARMNRAEGLRRVYRTEDASVYELR